MAEDTIGPMNAEVFPMMLKLFLKLVGFITWICSKTYRLKNRNSLPLGVTSDTMVIE